MQLSVQSNLRTFSSPPKRNPVHFSSHPLFFLIYLRGNIILLPMSYICQFWTSHGTIRYVVFHDWLLPARVFSRFIHVVALVLPFSLKLNSISLYWCTTLCLSSALFNGHLSCFHYYVWCCYKQPCTCFGWYIFYYLGMYLGV